MLKILSQAIARQKKSRSTCGANWKINFIPQKIPPQKIMVRPLCFNGKNQLNTILTLKFILLIFLFCMSNMTSINNSSWTSLYRVKWVCKYLTKTKLHSPRTIYMLCNIMYIVNKSVIIHTHALNHLVFSSVSFFGGSDLLQILRKLAAFNCRLQSFTF